MELLRLVENPYLWIYLTALPAGGACGHLLRSWRRGRNPVIGVSLLASAALAAFSLAILYSPPPLLHTDNILAAAVTVAVGALTALFPRLLLPLFSGSAALFYTLLLLSSPGGGDIDLAEAPVRLFVLGVQPDGTRSIEISHPSGTEIIRIDAREVRLCGRRRSVVPLLPWPEQERIIWSCLAEAESGEIVYSRETEAGRAGNGAGKAAALLQYIGAVEEGEWIGPALDLRLFAEYRIGMEEEKSSMSPYPFERKSPILLSE